MALIESEGATLKSRRRRRKLRSIVDDRESVEPVSAIADQPFASPLSRASKRAVDLVLAVPLALLALPLLVVIAFAIKCVSRGPIFYGQMRCGQHGRPFRIWKLRTMVEDAEHRLSEYLSEDPKFLEEWSTGFKSTYDPRVIPWIGRTLRFSSLDEIPQLWNVISGEMSLVGPRPLPEYHLEQFDQEFRRLRETMPPGVTGQWQVCSRANGAPDMFRKWDSYYVCHWSLWLDAKILARTPFAVISLMMGRGISAAGAAVHNS